MVVNPSSQGLNFRIRTVGGPGKASGQAAAPDKQWEAGPLGRVNEA